MAQSMTIKQPKSNFSAKDLAYMALCIALLAVCSWISIPTTVPFTLQTFGVFCVLELLGGMKGTMTIAGYLLLGLCGVPVFAGFTATSAFFGMTGGYLIGFLLTGCIYWLAEKLPLHKKFWFRLIVLIIGLLACYAFGTVWFIQVYTKQVETIGIAAALGMCVIPFLIPDGIKLALAMLLAGRIKKYVNL